MSSQTPNLNLVLPVGTEKVSRQIINDNNTKIDTAVGSNSSAIANLNNNINNTIATTIQQSGSNKVYLNRIGAFILCTFDGYLMNANNVIANFIPSGFRPAIGVACFVLMYKSNSDNYVATINIATNGSMTVRRKDTASSRDTTVDGYAIYGNMIWSAV